VIIVASRNGRVGLDAAWEVLEQGGSALDAIEIATRMVEDNPEDHTVGYSGYPNLLGEVELDASIMDGTTLRAGAVGALRGYRHAITVARQVMEMLPHVVLVGEGAARFAASLGMEAENLLTEEAEQAWRAGIAKRIPAALDVPDEQRADFLLQHARELVTDPERVPGTVNIIAQDSAGRIASAASTSGWAWKYPGRLGDTPLIGAGNYADNRYGAAACTGWGELALRAGTAHSVIHYVKSDYPLEAACRAAFADLLALGVNPTRIVMSMVAIDQEGNHCALSTAPGKAYVYRASGMDAPAEAPRLFVPLAEQA
jgi:beta-aspartyl-peptidase (threonine type)